MSFACLWLVGLYMGCRDNNEDSNVLTNQGQEPFESYFFPLTSNSDMYEDGHLNIEGCMIWKMKLLAEKQALHFKEFVEMLRNIMCENDDIAEDSRSPMDIRDGSLVDETMLTTKQSYANLNWAEISEHVNNTCHSLLGAVQNVAGVLKRTQTLDHVCGKPKLSEDPRYLIHLSRIGVILLNCLQAQKPRRSMSVDVSRNALLQWFDSPDTSFVTSSDSSQVMYERLIQEFNFPTVSSQNCPFFIQLVCERLLVCTTLLHDLSVSSSVDYVDQATPHLFSRFLCPYINVTNVANPGVVNIQLEKHSTWTEDFIALSKLVCQINFCRCVCQVFNVSRCVGV